MRRLAALLVFSLSCAAHAQWAPVTSPTKANLQSIHAFDKIVWISGDDGTVLRSADNGVSFVQCSVPKGAEHASLRSIQGVDADTAVVMSSGKGDRSALYRTADGCKTWKQVFANPEPQSSFDSLRRVTSKQIYLLTEPVEGKFVLYLSRDGGVEWLETADPGLEASAGETAVGSLLLAQGPFLYFGTAAPEGPFVHYTAVDCPAGQDGACPMTWKKTQVPASQPGLGIRALVVQPRSSVSGKMTLSLAAVGGSVKNPELTLAATSEGGSQWTAATVPPRGERTAVMVDQATQTLVAVGPNGTDLSKDYGKHWMPAADTAGAGWNALSLPFAVGDGGRIATLVLNNTAP